MLSKVLNKWMQLAALGTNCTCSLQGDLHKAEKKVLEREGVSNVQHWNLINEGQGTYSSCRKLKRKYKKEGVSNVQHWNLINEGQGMYSQRFPNSEVIRVQLNGGVNCQTEATVTSQCDSAVG
ncbi:UNVERIFIED_CONTAM: hypothetical protein FKN15_001497 [Acipenser sinensis]